MWFSLAQFNIPLLQFLPTVSIPTLFLVTYVTGRVTHTKLVQIRWITEWERANRFSCGFTSLLFSIPSIKYIIICSVVTAPEVRISTMLIKATFADELARHNSNKRENMCIIMTIMIIIMARPVIAS